MKAILEIELPTCCATCRLLKVIGVRTFCGGIPESKPLVNDLYNVCDPECPLKIVDESVK